MNTESLESLMPARLRVGRCLVDPVSREVHAPGLRRPLRLTPKAMAVLRVLALRAGEVVTREQLLAEVWPDTMPTNDVVTQAVTQLRKALAAAGEERGAGGIETIAKTGYRLLAPVSWEPSEDAAGLAAPSPLATAREAGAATVDPLPRSPVEAENVLPAPPPTGAGARRRWRLWAVACLVVLSVAFAGGMFAARYLRDDAPAGVVAQGDAPRVTGVPRLPYRLITSSGNFDITPTLSPDGSMVAYTSVTPDRPGTSILVKTTDAAPPRVLSRTPQAAQDRLPAWSPDGRQIAFVRQSQDGQCRVMLASANGGGDERELVRCDGSDMLSFSWAPDGRALLFGTMTGEHPGRGIRRLELDTGRWQAIAYRSGPEDFDYAPQYSPDGRWIAFARNPQMGDVWLLPAQGGDPQPLTRDSAEIRGLTWLPDSTGVVFGRRVDSQSRLYRVDLGTHLVRDLGVDDAQAPVISANQGKLAFVQRRPQFGVYRIRHDALGNVRRERLFASNGRDSQPMVAPSGRQLVFASDRSGQYQLWWADLTTPESLRPIDGLVPETRQSPDWSPDSLSLLVAAREGNGEPALYEVMPALNRLAMLPVPEPRPLQAVYLSDPRRILVLSATDSGGARLTLYDRSTRPWSRLKVLEDVSQVRFDREHGDVLLTRFSRDGLWRVDQSLDAGSLSEVVPDAPTRWRYRSWAVAGGQIHYLWSSGECAAYDSRLDAAAARERDGYCVDNGRFSATNGFSVDPRGNALYVALAAEDGSEIGFMNLPHEHPGFIGVAPKLLNW